MAIVKFIARSSENHLKLYDQLSLETSNLAANSTPVNYSAISMAMVIFP